MGLRPSYVDMVACNYVTLTLGVHKNNVIFSGSITTQPRTRHILYYHVVVLETALYTLVNDYTFTPLVIITTPTYDMTCHMHMMCRLTAM